MTPGAWLEQTRRSCGLTTRDVERFSRLLAAVHGARYRLSHTHVRNYELDVCVPSIYGLKTLASVYGCAPAALASLYGLGEGASVPRVDRGRGPADGGAAAGEPAGEASRTAGDLVLPGVRATIEVYGAQRRAVYTALLSHQFDPRQTTFFADWRRVFAMPSGPMVRHLRAVTRPLVYEPSAALSPLAEPGSFLLVDTSHRARRLERPCATLHRPVYLLEVRDRISHGGRETHHECVWCEPVGTRYKLTQPRAVGPRLVRASDVDVIGMCSRVLMRLVPAQGPSEASSSTPD